MYIILLLFCIVDSNKHFLIGQYTQKYTMRQSLTMASCLVKHLPLQCYDTGGRQEAHVTCKTSWFSSFQRFFIGNSWGTVKWIISRCRWKQNSFIWQLSYFIPSLTRKQNCFCNLTLTCKSTYDCNFVSRIIFSYVYYSPFSLCFIFILLVTK